jgi:hypothetical protein
MTRSQNLIKSCKKEKLLRAKKFIIVMFSKKSIYKQNFYFHLLLFAFLKYKHDSIISWNQITKTINFTRFLSHSLRFYRCISKKFRSWFRILFFRFSFHVNHFESIFSRTHFRFFKRYRSFWFKNSWIFVKFV